MTPRDFLPVEVGSINVASNASDALKNLARTMLEYMEQNFIAKSAWTKLILPRRQKSTPTQAKLFLLTKRDVPGVVEQSLKLKKSLLKKTSIIRNV
jgi:hypothetical protein